MERERRLEVGAGVKEFLCPEKDNFVISQILLPTLYPVFLLLAKARVRIKQQPFSSRNIYWQCSIFHSRINSVALRVRWVFQRQESHPVHWRTIWLLILFSCVPLVLTVKLVLYTKSTSVCDQQRPWLHTLPVLTPHPVSPGNLQASHYLWIEHISFKLCWNFPLQLCFAAMQGYLTSILL